MENWKFANSQLLWLLLIIPVLWIFIKLWIVRYRKCMKKFGRAEVISGLFPEAKLSKKIWKDFIMTFAMAFLIIALARPQVGVEKSTKEAKGSEIVMVMDVSNSMLARKSPKDLSRLDKAKFAAYRLINRFKNDKVSLVIFAGQAAMVMPMTDDYDALRLYISELSTNYIYTQGTALSDALELAKNAFTPDQDVNKAVVIFSDGEDLYGKADDIAKEMSSEGIRIYTVGIGSPRGNPIYLPGGNTLTYKGNIVISKMDESYLKKLASIGKGLYVNATNRPDAVKAIYEDIEKHSSGISSVYSRFADVFYYFVAIALFLLFIEFFILERKNRWISKFNLFEK